MLHKAIQDKLNIRIANLPTSSHSQFFRKTTEEILTLPLQQQKDWFVTVRGRHMTHIVNLLTDQFTKQGILQQLVSPQKSL